MQCVKGLDPLQILRWDIDKQSFEAMMPFPNIVESLKVAGGVMASSSFPSTQNTLRSAGRDYNWRCLRPAILEGASHSTLLFCW